MRILLTLSTSLPTSSFSFAESFQAVLAIEPP
jgi:hypothetical protein